MPLAHTALRAPRVPVSTEPLVALVGGMQQLSVGVFAPRPNLR